MLTPPHRVQVSDPRLPAFSIVEALDGAEHIGSRSSRALYCTPYDRQMRNLLDPQSCAERAVVGCSDLQLKHICRGCLIILGRPIPAPEGKMAGRNIINRGVSPRSKELDMTENSVSPSQAYLKARAASGGFPQLPRRSGN